MKKSLLSGTFILFFVQVFGQRITGTVYDKLTQMVLPGAIVFFNGSTIGTRTNRTGDFQLVPPESQRLPVVAAYNNHETLLLLEYPIKAHVHFYLDPRFNSLDNALDSKEDKRSRNENLKVFREQFLGNSINGASCRILNEYDLKIKYDPRTALLKVQSVKPLIIVNKGLGYHIIYYLRKFEFSGKSQLVSCTGYSQFSEEPGLNGKKLELAEKRRKLAYFGSEMEFFRALWNNSLDSAGYDLRTSSNKKLTYDSLVLESNGTKYWRYKDPVTIYHFSKNKSTTFQTADTVYFDKLGYSDSQGVNWKKSGEMTFQRLGDQLPFDYKVTQNRSNIPE